MKKLISLSLFVVACGGGNATTTETQQQTMTHHDHHTTNTTEEAHAEGEKHAEGHAHNHRFDDPSKYADRWNAPERAATQKPDEVIALMGIEAGATVADLGAGTGYFIPYLSAAVGPTGKVYALDVEDNMLKFIGEMAAKEGLTNVETKKTPFDSTGLGTGSLDRLLTVNVWHHIENREAYAKHLFDVVKPGGKVVVVDFTKEAPEGPPAAMRLEPQVILDELRAGGFEVSLAQETLPDHYIVVGLRK